MTAVNPAGLVHVPDAVKTVNAGGVELGVPHDGAPLVVAARN
jgi:hypothetical protein